MNTFGKKELVELMRQHYRAITGQAITGAFGELIFEALTNAIESAISNPEVETICLRKIGRIVKKVSPGRRYHNPRTGDTGQSAPKKVIRFRASKKLEREINID